MFGDGGNDPLAADMPSLCAVVSRMRWLAWWGTIQSMSVTATPAMRAALAIAAVVFTTACLKTSRPCMRSMPVVCVVEGPPST